MKKHIVVVDDDAAILDAIGLTLQEEGYKVTTFSRGHNFLHFIKDNDADLIILDMLLSGMDGRDITKAIKKDKDKKDIPVLMISAHPSAFKSVGISGADAFLPKPFDTLDLLLEVERLAV